MALTYLIKCFYIQHTQTILLSFLKIESLYVIELMNIFDTFSKFSGLKPNKSKCEIASIGALKGVQVALCSMRFIDLVSNIVKILGIYCSFNDKLEIQENFKRQKNFSKNFTIFENERFFNCGQNYCKHINKLQ